MPSVVGQKGQVVISKKIRDELGVAPGWMAVQSVVNGHLEIHFFPPMHNRSLLGCLAPYTDVVVQPEDDWAKIKEDAWAEAVQERFERIDHES